jgi:iron(III) transport system permease protein
MLGLLTSYVLARQRFRGRGAFEFGTMLSFAIPGTVVGVSYVLAFNAPPIEMTGTGALLVVCFVFRNMPVGVRTGLATLSQIDQSLDEASLTLGASSFRTVRQIVLPLLKPALIAAIVYGFVRAMTAVSAVIFLVSHGTGVASASILNFAEQGYWGQAAAMASSLILVALVTLGLFRLALGGRAKLFEL